MTPSASSGWIGREVSACAATLMARRIQGHPSWGGWSGGFVTDFEDTDPSDTRLYVFRIKRGGNNTHLTAGTKTSWTSLLSSTFTIYHQHASFEQGRITSILCWIRSWIRGMWFYARQRGQSLTTLRPKSIRPSSLRTDSGRKRSTKHQLLINSRTLLKSGQLDRSGKPRHGGSRNSDEASGFDLIVFGCRETSHAWTPRGLGRLPRTSFNRCCSVGHHWNQERSWYLRLHI